MGLLILRGSQLVLVEVATPFGEAPVLDSLLRGLCDGQLAASAASPYLGDAWHQSKLENGEGETCFKQLEFAVCTVFGSDLNGGEVGDWVAMCLGMALHCLFA